MWREGSYLDLISKNPIGEWVKVICPNCKNQKIFWDNGSKKEDHWCDTCKEIVIIA